MLAGADLAPVLAQARRNARAQPLHRIYLARALLRSGRAAAARRQLEALPESQDVETGLERGLYLARAWARTDAVPEAVALMQDSVARRPENADLPRGVGADRGLRQAA